MQTAAAASQWVLFPNCSISCMYCSRAGTTTHVSFKEEERMKSAGAVLSWESSALRLSHAPPRQPVCPRAGLSWRPATQPSLSWQVAPTVVPECTLLVTFLHCSGSVLPSLKLLSIFIRQPLPVMTFNTKLFKPLSLQ